MKDVEALKEYRSQQQGVNVHADEYLDIIEKELKRLARIDDLLEEIGIDENDLPIWFEMQKQDGKKVKALEIIKEKEVNVFIFLHSGDLETYNDMVEDNRKLTEEEYNLVKEVLL